MPLVLCADSVLAVALLTLQQHLQRGIQASTEIICEELCRLSTLTHPLLPCRKKKIRVPVPIPNPLFPVSEKDLHIKKGPEWQLIRSMYLMPGRLAAEVRVLQGRIMLC